MVSLFDGYNHIIRLQRNERLAAALQQFMAEQDVQGAWLSGIGGAVEVELGFYDLETRAYRWRTFSRLLEITSLQGNIALDPDGKPICHLHGTFSDDTYQAIGGHVKDLVVGGTCELFVHRTYRPLHRHHDDEVGLAILDL